MMTRAYSEYYLSDAKTRLASMFDYAVNDLGQEPDWIAKLFVQSGMAAKFETGNPSVIAGMSGVEIAEEVIRYAYKDKELPEATFRQDRSPEYWAGWALAEYQWFTGRRYRDIFAKVTLSEIISMYRLYHEMDIRQFIDSMENRYKDARSDTKLKTIREHRGLSQTELAQLSGVNVRSIQMYEQRMNDIDKAQAHTLYKLARVLGCTVEDLLEDPSK